MGKRRLIPSFEFFAIILSSIVIGVLMQLSGIPEPANTVMLMVASVFVSVAWLVIFGIRNAQREVDEQRWGDSGEVLKMALPHLREGRVVSGTRRPDGTIDLHVGESPEDRQADQPQ